jgi:hypothetical protein
MVSPVRIRISPLLFGRSLQEKRRDLVEFRLWIGALYTNDYTNALGQKYVQPIGHLSSHIRQHVRVEVEGHVYPGVAEHLLDHLGVFAAGEHEGREAVAQLWRSAWNGMSGKPARWSSGLKERLKTLWRLRGVPTVKVRSRPVSCQAAIGCSSKDPRRSTDFLETSGVAKAR